MRIEVISRSLRIGAIGICVGMSLTSGRAAAQPKCHYREGIYAGAEGGATCFMPFDAPTTWTQEPDADRPVFETRSGGFFFADGDFVLINRSSEGVGAGVSGSGSSHVNRGSLDILASGDEGVGVRVEDHGRFTLSGDMRVVAGSNGVGLETVGQGTAELDGNVDIRVGDGTGSHLAGLRVADGGFVDMFSNAMIRVEGDSSASAGARIDGVVAEGASGGASVAFSRAVTIDVSGRNARGASASQASTNKVDFVGAVGIRVRGAGARGLHADDGALVSVGGQTYIVHDGAHDAAGGPSAAVHATSSALGGGRIALHHLAASAKGAGVHGVVADNSGGAAGGTVGIQGRADIEVEGADAMGVSANGPGSKVSMLSGAVRASGSGGIGLRTSGSGSSVWIGPTDDDPFGTLDTSSVFGRRHAVSMGEGSGQSVYLEGTALASEDGAVIAAHASQSATLELRRGEAVAAAGRSLLAASAGTSLDFVSRNSSLKGAVVASGDSTVNLKLSERSELTGGVEGANLDIDQTSLWTLTSSSRTGAIRHAGRIVFEAPGAMFVPRTLTVGRLEGQGGSVRLNTVLGNSSSASDQIVLTGPASGQTKLLIRNAGGAGASTADGHGIRVVDAQGAGSTAGRSFALGAPVTAGPFEYLLQRGSAEDGNDWYLRSKLPAGPGPGPEPGPEPGPGPDPEPGPGPGPGPTPRPEQKPEVQLYRPAVAGYLVAGSLYNQMGLGLMGRLHERVPTGGDDASDAGHDSQVWVRTGGNSLSQSGKARFGSDGRQAFVQLGKDLARSRHADGGGSRSGFMLTASRVDADFEDRVRPRAGRSARAGDMRGSILALGGFHTRRFANRAYLDVVAQAERLDSRYQDAYGVRARTGGWGLGLSLEVGRPFALGASGWLIEPQAQLSWHRVDLDSFEDGISRIDPEGNDLLRGRVGVRLVSDAGPAPSREPRLWLGADLLHEIRANDAALRVDDHLIEEELTASWMEVGAGAEWPIAPQATLYGHLKYQRQAFDDEPLSGLSAAVGLRTVW